MDENEMLAALAEKHPKVRRYIAEYTSDGRAAIEAFMEAEPAAFVAFKLDMDRLLRGDII